MACYLFVNDWINCIFVGQNKLLEMATHPSLEVNQALIKLADALCQWERSTGNQSILILREQGIPSIRFDCGKPTIPEDMLDSEVLEMLIR